MRALGSVVLVLCLVGCGSPGGPSNAGPDLSAAAPAGPDMQPFSACGHPGDVGNNLGIGKYCDLSNLSCGFGIECSALFNSQLPADQQTYFCTKGCGLQTSATTPDPAVDCGTGARCQCNATACACVPLACYKGD
jgi:hypothetical protein